MSDSTFGHVPGIEVGALFPDRVALSLAGVHRPRRAGICGRAKEGAESIILNCAFVDDRDRGDSILYTGSGARHPKTGRQIGDQTLARSNLALAESARRRLPVRVSRGVGRGVWDPPLEGYRYDGLYTVQDYYAETGLDGYRIWRFVLEAVAGESRARPAPG
ncbi:YDG/SRA domain-containing protein [Rubrivirga sp.]|uniref:YDG/SRA domain-containing protein n=1 Tax=Rubrivirga sp. TaxID=1885344 RepID=UPI003C789F46